MDMMFNTEMIVKVLKGGKEDMTENKRFTREEVIKMIHDVRVHYYRMFGDEMSLSERLFFTDIGNTIENQVDYEMELLEKELQGND